MSVENTQGETYQEPAYRAARGPLHVILTNGLPDLCSSDTGLCNMRRLADALGKSKQAVYKYCRPNAKNELPGGVVPAIVKLSSEQKSRPKHFKQITADDLLPFITERVNPAD